MHLSIAKQAHKLCALRVTLICETKNATTMAKWLVCTEVGSIRAAMTRVWETSDCQVHCTLESTPPYKCITQSLLP